MDFHSLPRRDLQTLCKKNHIPANITNVAMADALQALQNVEGLEEFLQGSVRFQSPRKEEIRSPELPRTSRRTSARRAAISVEHREQKSSPLPRARRVATKASEIMRLVCEGEVEDEMNKDGPLEEIVPKTPAAHIVSKPQGTTARSTRRRASKKEETEGGNKNHMGVVNTPATRNNGRRATARKGTEVSVAVEEEGEETLFSLRTTRRTRHSSKAIPMEVTDTAARRRSTRIKAAVNKMVSLAQEYEQKEAKDMKTNGSLNQTDGPLHFSDEKHPHLAENVYDLCSGDLEEKVEESDGIQDRLVANEDSENYLNEVLVFEDVDYPYDQLAGELKFEVIQEMEGLGREHEKAGNDLSMEESDGIQCKTADTEYYGPDYDAYVEAIDLPQHQLVDETKEDEVIQLTRLDGEEILEGEKVGHGVQEVNQADNALSGVEGSPIRGLIYSLESLEIVGDVADEQNKKDEDKGMDVLPDSETMLETKGSNAHLIVNSSTIETFSYDKTDASEILLPMPVTNDYGNDASLEFTAEDIEEPINGDEVLEEAMYSDVKNPTDEVKLPELGKTVQDLASSTLQRTFCQAPELHLSTVAGSPAEILAESVDPVNDFAESPAKSSVDVKNLSGVCMESMKSAARTSNMIENDPDATRTNFKEDESKENSTCQSESHHSNKDKENEYKVETESEKSSQKVDLNSLSYRKLRSLYKEKIININNKVDMRRPALAEINENL